MYRVQIIDEKKGVICLVMMFTPRVIVTEMPKNDLCFVVSNDESKKWSQFGQNI